MFAGKKSAQIREILISESAWEEMTCLFAPSTGKYIFLNNHKTGIIRRHKCNGVNRNVMMFSFVTEENRTYHPQSLSSGITSPGQRLLLMPDEPDRREK
ncbi:TPA: hypothetical protein ACIF5A_004799, partial [Escherichia coli]